MSKRCSESSERKPKKEKMVELPLSVVARLARALESPSTSQGKRRSNAQARYSPGCKQRPRTSKGSTSAGNARASSVGELVALLPVSCKYSEEGCREQMARDEMRKHEAKCRFRPSSCPYVRPKCSWKGPICRMVAHIREEHDVDLYRGEEVPLEIRDFSGGWHNRALWFQQCFGHFFLILLVSPRSDCTKATHLLVQMIGGPEETERFTYHVELEYEDHSISWSGEPLSIEDSISAAVGPDADCLIFDPAPFTSDRGKLEIVIKISEEE